MARKLPWRLGHLYSNSLSVLHDGFWVRAVARPYPGLRLQAAWWVLTGRAHAFLWPEPGELERVIAEPMAEPPGAPCKACGHLPYGFPPHRPGCRLAPAAP